VPAGGAIHSVLGRLGHQPPGTMTGTRGARWTGTGWGGCHARQNCARSAPPGWGELTGPDAPATSQEAIGPCRAFGTTTPLGKNRGGTPTGELPQKGRAAPDGAEDTDQRLSAFRFLDLLANEGETNGKTETHRSVLVQSPKFALPPSRSALRRTGHVAGNCKTRAHMRRENMEACLFTVILRCSRAARASKETAEAPGPRPSRLAIARRRRA
jgi:hypothetical protein